MEEQRVSDERLAELIADCKSSRAFRQVMPDDVLAMATELQTSRSALSEAEGLVREMAELNKETMLFLNTIIYVEDNMGSGGKIVINECDSADARLAKDFKSRISRILARPSVAAILARGEK